MKSRLELHYSFSIALPLLLSNILNKVSHPIYVKLKNDCNSLYTIKNYLLNSITVNCHILLC